MIDGKLPDTRFMVSGNQGMSLSLNNLAADLVEAVADKLSPNSIEVKSSEHLLYRFNKYNKELENKILEASSPKEVEDLMETRLLLATDVKALFQSMKVDTTSRIVSE